MPQQFRRHEPDERSRPVLGEPLKIDSTDPALSELERTLGTDEMCGELSKTRFMTDKRDPSALRGLRQLLHHLFRRVTRRERGERLDRGFSRDAGGEQIGRLLRAHKRAAEDLVKSDVQPVETGKAVLESNDAFFRQRTFVVIRPIVAALGGDRMAHDVELTWRR